MDGTVPDHDDEVDDEQADEPAGFEDPMEGNEEMDDSGTFDNADEEAAVSDESVLSDDDAVMEDAGSDDGASEWAED